MLNPFKSNKRTLTRYVGLTWESVEFDDSTVIFASGMISLCFVHLTFYAIPLSNYHVMYDITTIPDGTLL